MEQVRALAGRGLVGDRYAAGEGTFSRVKNQNVRELTLVGHAAFEALVRGASGGDWVPGDLRRNVVLDGPTEELDVGAVLSIGDCSIQITGSCPPCGHLDRLLGVDTRAHLAGIGGWRARILEDGDFARGDVVKLERRARRLP